jgi:hypothetical protein
MERDELTLYGVLNLNGRFIGYCMEMVLYLFAWKVMNENVVDCVGV